MPQQATALFKRAFTRCRTNKQQLIDESGESNAVAGIAVGTAVAGMQRQDFLQDWYKLVTQKNMPMAIATKWNKALNFSDFEPNV